MKELDYVVVGSGCSGAIAAQTLVEAGVRVAMLDVGEKDDSYAAMIPDKDFLSIRKTESEQYRYFIGEEADGIVWSDIGKGAQITPPRKHMLKLVDSHLPVDSSTFSPLESLGYGGLGISWGLQCWEYSPNDLRATGLNPIKMRAAYELVSSRIGVSATKDDASRYTLGSLKTFQDSPRMDRNHNSIYKKYNSKKKKLNSKGLYLSRTPLALLTKDLNGRKKYDYKDMDYYSDNDQSAWRPWITVNQLKKRKNFSYYGGYLLTSFSDKGQYIELYCTNTQTNQPEKFRCRKLILATGALGSARVTLRSLANEKTTVPLLCNPYTYIPCLQPSMLGKGVEEKKLGFAQLSLFLDQQGKDTGVSVASLYSYQSLMMFRTIRQLPLAFTDARLVLQYIMPGIVIMGVHHPDSINPHKYLRLIKDKSSPTGDKLEISYQLTDGEKSTYRQRERTLMKAGRKLGIIPLKRIDPGYGASIHYAGTLPFSNEDKPFTLSKQGRIHGTKNVYVADSSGFNYLPAKGLTFTLMANAHLVAKGVLDGAS